MGLKIALLGISTRTKFKKINKYLFLIVYQYNYFVLCTEMNDVSNPHEKMIAINRGLA